MTKFIAAAATAVVNEQTSLKAAQALLEFPVDPDAHPDRQGSSVYADVLIQGIGTTDLNFGVPADYLYALGADFDKSTTADRRYQIATGETIERILQEIQTAINDQAITDDAPYRTSTASAISKEQAANRLVALGARVASNGPAITVPNPLPSSGTFVQVVQAWLQAKQPPNPPPAGTATDWGSIETKAGAQAYLNLVLLTLTQGYLIPGPSPQEFLADKIAAALLSAFSAQTVSALTQVKDKQWTDFFTKKSFIPNAGIKPIPLQDTLDLLPPFTQPGNPNAGLNKNNSLTAGYVAARIQAFIRAVKRFFAVSSADVSTPAYSSSAAPGFELPSYDAITQAIGFYQGGGSFVFGSGALNNSQLQSAVQNVFPGDTEAQTWLTQAILAINELYQIAQTVPNPVKSASLQFSIVEALYVRGFTSAKAITALYTRRFPTSPYRNSGLSVCQFRRYFVIRSR